MPTKMTKVQLENALKLAEEEKKAALDDLKNFKKRIPQVMKEKIEEYDLDICDDGLADFASTLGIEWDTTREGTATIYISGIKLPAKKAYYGFDFDDDATAKFEEALKDALEPVVSKYGGSRYDIDFDTLEMTD